MKTTNTATVETIILLPFAGKYQKGRTKAQRAADRARSNADFDAHMATLAAKRTTR